MRCSALCSPGRLLGRNTKSIEHQMRRMTQIVAILKLPKILLKMFLRDVNAGPVDAAL